MRERRMLPPNAGLDGAASACGQPGSSAAMAIKGIQSARLVRHVRQGLQEDAARHFRHFRHFLFTFIEKRAKREPKAPPNLARCLAGSLKDVQASQRSMSALKLSPSGSSARPSKTGADL
jgi:hypothetical protein